MKELRLWGLRLFSTVSDGGGELGAGGGCRLEARLLIADFTPH